MSKIKWTEDKLAKLRQLCEANEPNRKIAAHFGVSLEEIHAARSRYNLTINKVAQNVAQSNGLKKCDCCQSLCKTTTTMILPDGMEAEFCLHCEATNDYLAAHQPPEDC